MPVFTRVHAPRVRAHTQALTYVSGVAALDRHPLLARAHRDGGTGNTSRSEREESRFEAWSLCARFMRMFPNHAGMDKQRRHAAADRDLTEGASPSASSMPR